LYFVYLFYLFISMFFVHLPGYPDCTVALLLPSFAET
jgi:hypothetical protein